VAVPKEKIDKLRSEIKESGEVLICINSKSSLDTYSAAVAFAVYLEDLEKKVSIVVDQKPTTRYRRIFKKAELEYKQKLEKLNYVVSIDHSGGEVEKVSYDDEGGKFNLYITPSGSGEGFDFENVEFNYSGGKYDMVFVFGARSLNWLGSLYNDNEKVFTNNVIVNINNLKGSQDFGKFKLVDTEIAVGEIIFQLLNGESTESTRKIYQLLLLGILDFLQPMQRNDYKISTVEALTSSVKFGADLKEAFQDLYFNRSSGYFELVKKLFSNLKADEDSGLVWSGVSHFDISQTEASRDDIPLNGRIPFNISGEFEIAFVLYEVEEDEVWVEFESNSDEVNAKDILKSFNPSGNEARVVFSVKDKSLLEVENEILDTLKDALDLEEIDYQVENTFDSEKNGDLTGSSNDANNITAQNNSNDDEEDGAFITPPPITPSS
jgi:nanoRNase/pAp phosphatase (c-di-AMP/oligoRNAs hydrolase)